MFNEEAHGQEDQIEWTLEMGMASPPPFLLDTFFIFMAFKTLRGGLLEMLALALLESHKPFHLYVDEKKGITKGVLMQTLGP